MTYLLFLLSFQTTSLVAVYLSFLLIKRNVYLVLLPAAYWVFKSVFLKPHGFYGADYQQIHPEMLDGFFHKVLSTTINNAWKPVTIDVQGVSTAYYLFGLLVFTIGFYVYLKGGLNDQEKT